MCVGNYDAILNKLHLGGTINFITYRHLNILTSILRMCVCMHACVCVYVYATYSTVLWKERIIWEMTEHKNRKFQNVCQVELSHSSSTG